MDYGGAQLDIEKDYTYFVHNFTHKETETT
jgi:hypothetical protein